MLESQQSTVVDPVEDFVTAFYFDPDESQSRASNTSDEDEDGALYDLYGDDETSSELIPTHGATVLVPSKSKIRDEQTGITHTLVDEESYLLDDLAVREIPISDGRETNGSGSGGSKRDRLDSNIIETSLPVSSDGETKKG